MGQGLRTYEVRYTTQLEVTLIVLAEDEEQANELGGQRAEEFAQALGTGPGSGSLRANATFDGIGADSVEELKD